MLAQSIKVAQQTTLPSVLHSLVSQASLQPRRSGSAQNKSVVVFGRNDNNNNNTTTTNTNDNDNDNDNDDDNDDDDDDTSNY